MKKETIYWASCVGSPSWKLRGDTGISGKAKHRHASDTTHPSSRTENDNIAHERGGGLLKVILATGIQQCGEYVAGLHPSGAGAAAP